jgi:limonene-1,2-epoxide hydrolase
MTPEQTVGNFIAAIERRDLDAALALMAPDCEYDNVPMAKVVGHEAIRNLLESFVTTSDSVQFEVLRQVASGDTVMNERVDRFDMGAKRVEIAVAGVFVVDGGLISLWRDYFDLAQFTAQMS